MILRLRGRVLELREPLLMGIVNATPDSFSETITPQSGLGGWTPRPMNEIAARSTIA